MDSLNILLSGQKVRRALELSPRHHRPSGFTLLVVNGLSARRQDVLPTLSDASSSFRLMLQDLPLQQSTRLHT